MLEKIIEGLYDDNLETRVKLVPCSVNKTMGDTKCHDILLVKLQTDTAFL